MNSTSEGIVWYLNAEFYAIVWHVLISLTGLVMNTSVVLIPHTRDPLRCFKSPSSLFMLNIGVVDTISSVALTVTRLLLLYRVTGNHLTNGMLIVMSVSYKLTFITCPAYCALVAERYCSVAYPMWHRTHVTTRRCWYAIGAVWALHFVFEGAGLVYTRPEDVRMDAVVFTYAFVFMLSSQALAFASFVPLKRQRKRMLAATQSNMAAPATIVRLDNEKHFMWTVTIVSFIAAATQLPIIIYLIWRKEILTYLAKNSIASNFVVNITFGLLTSNYAINPFVYLWRLPKYKKTCRKLYCNKK